MYFIFIGMISVYDKLIDNLKSYAVPYEDHPQESSRDFEYDHPLTGIENDRAPNIDGLSFNIDGLEELNVDEIEQIYEKLSEANKLTYLREYDEDEQKELFTYYKGTDSLYKDKKIPRTSAIHVRNLKNHVQSVMYKKRMAIRDQNATELLPTLEKFLEVHKQGNLNIYPDWLKFKFKEVRWGDLYIQPIINIEKLLESGDSILQAKRTRDFITKIWNRLVSSTDNSFSNTKISPSVKTTYVLFEGFKDYVKNIVNKKIKPQIKNLPRGKECVHSIIFRYRSNLDDIEIQIHPRYKRECTEGWNRLDTYDFEEEIEDVLYEYGWRKGINYVTSTNKD